MAVTSLICGIVSVPLFCFWFVSVPLAVVAVTLGPVARGRARRGVADGGGIVVAGITCGAVTLGILVSPFVAALLQSLW